MLKTFLQIKNNLVQNKINLPDGTYDVEIKVRDKSHTIEQIKKLWATIDDISKAQNGDTSKSMDIYFEILNICGIATQKIAIRNDVLNDFLKSCRAYSIIGNETIKHQEYTIVNACFKGVSQFSKKELSNTIETTIRYASELGITTELEGWHDGN